MSERDVTLRDGRTLHVYDDGAPDGVAVVLHNGTPSSGLLYAGHVEDARSRGIRLIGYDRAGYGASTAKPGRTVADVVADVEDALDALGIALYATWGISGGGPHALACAALSERCVAAATLASAGPYGVPGLDWLEGMGEANVAEFDAVLAGPEALEPLLRRDAAEMFAGTADDLRQAMITLLSPPDEAALTEDFGAYLYDAMSRGVADRIDGWRDDNLAFVRPWGFELSDVRVPVLLWQGVQDLMVPPAHGRWLAERIPGVEAHISEEDGHLTLLRHRVPEIHEWLRGAFAGPTDRSAKERGLDS
jgi:pimeloyl-ACP methyl ester carboxylesterase